jgi:hypothetical protein
MVMRTYTGPFGRRPLILDTGDPSHRPVRSVRFPCLGRIEGGGRCTANWNVETPRLLAAYERAVAEGKRELTFGVDL